MNNFLIKKSVACIALLLSACNSKQVVDDAQCSDSEQGMFLTCIESGCSATYSQDLSGTDACAIEGGGSVVSVEAGGECGFTSSGSCYVVCDCPEGVSVEMSIGAENQDSDTHKDEASDIADAAISLIMEKIALLESLISSLTVHSQMSEEKDQEIEDAVIAIESRLESKIDSLTALHNEEVASLQSEIDSLRSEIQVLRDSSIQSQGDITQVFSEIRELDVRVTNIENVQLDLSEDVLSLYDSVGLQISHYEVDCNQNNLAAAQRIPFGISWIEDRKCVLVENVDVSNTPVVSVAQKNTSWFTDYVTRGGAVPGQNWLDEFKVGVRDGGYSPGGGDPDDTYLGPGHSLRYDPTTQEIYTAGHWKNSSTDLNPNIYIVTVIGNQSYTSPY